MKPIPLFGVGINAYSAAVSRQRRLNCFVELRQDEDKKATIIRGTPGAFAAFTLPTYPIRGWWIVNGLLYVVSGNALYSLTTTGVNTLLGTLSTRSGYVEMVDNGVQLVVVDGVHGYCYTIVTGSYAQSALNSAGAFGIISDANFPSGALTCAFIDGRIIVERRPNSRQFYCSNQYDATAWTNASSLPTYGTKDNASDSLQAVDVLNGAIVLWGSQTIEFWQDVGASPLPFARINGATQTWGLAALYSRAPLNNTMVFLGQNDQGGIQVFMLNGYAPQRISTSDIENIITSFSTYQDAVALTYIVDGHPMYQLTFPSANRSFLFDALTNFWSEVQTGLGLISRHFANLGINYNTINYVSDVSTGTIYQISETTYTDNGSAIKRQVTSRHVNASGNMMTISELLLDMETGVGLQNGQGKNPQIMLQVSRDYGRTFGNERWVSIGAVGQYFTRAIWRRLGSARDFVFQFTMTDPVKFTIIHGSASTEQEEGAING